MLKLLKYLTKGDWGLAVLALGFYCGPSLAGFDHAGLHV